MYDLEIAPQRKNRAATLADVRAVQGEVIQNITGLYDGLHATRIKDGNVSKILDRHEIEAKGNRIGRLETFRGRGHEPADRFVFQLLVAVRDLHEKVAFSENAHKLITVQDDNRGSLCIAHRLHDLCNGLFRNDGNTSRRLEFHDRVAQQTLTKIGKITFRGDIDEISLALVA